MHKHEARQEGKLPMKVTPNRQPAQGRPSDDGRADEIISQGLLACMAVFVAVAIVGDLVLQAMGW
jgi:hypothetical protein